MLKPQDACGSMAAYADFPKLGSFFLLAHKNHRFILGLLNKKMETTLWVQGLGLRV